MNGWMRVRAALIALVTAGGSTLLAHDVPDAVTAGQFYAPHRVAVDSRGNLFTTETYEGKRVQKFVYRGLRKVAKEQGGAWAR